ncbi:MAG: septum formation initiator family protein [Caldisericia bacterium]|nr:septum formation initiator family protein [Caldisericia bacterium]
MEEQFKKRRREIEAAIFIVIIIFSLYYFSVPILKLVSLKREITQIKREMEIEREEIVRLKNELIESKTDEYVERWAKENLKMVKDGEKIYIVKDKD